MADREREEKEVRERGSEVATVWRGVIGKKESYVHSQFYVFSSCLDVCFIREVLAGGGDLTEGLGPPRCRGAEHDQGKGGSNLCVVVVVVVIVLGDYLVWGKKGVFL